MQPDKAQHLFEHMEHHRYRVISAHEYTANDPLQVRVDEEVTLTGKEDYWADRPEWCWLWAVSKDGKEGWIPKNYVELLSSDTSHARVLHDYDASELTVTLSEIVSADDVVNGWRWATNQSGQSGWVPADNLEPITSILL
jgi:Variant SH3 domain